MQPVSNAFTTITLGAPVNWNEPEHGKCHGLPVHIPDDRLHVYSYWALTWRERLAVLFGKTIRLAIFGDRQPPCHLEVDPD